MASVQRPERCLLCSLMSLDVSKHLISVHGAKRSNSMPHTVSSTFRRALASGSTSVGLCVVPRVSRVVTEPSAPISAVRRVSAAPSAKPSATADVTGRSLRGHGFLPILLLHDRSVLPFLLPQRSELRLAVHARLHYSTSARSEPRLAVPRPSVKEEPSNAKTTRKYKRKKAEDKVRVESTNAAPLPVRSRKSKNEATTSRLKTSTDAPSKKLQIEAPLVHLGH